MFSCILNVFDKSVVQYNLLLLVLQFMCSYIMWPIAIIIGIDANECREAAKLIGIKIFATELLAYQELGRSVDQGLLSVRINYFILINIKLFNERGNHAVKCMQYRLSQNRMLAI